jgi:hypothetical protein
MMSHSGSGQHPVTGRLRDFGSTDTASSPLFIKQGQAQFTCSARRVNRVGTVDIWWSRCRVKRQLGVGWSCPLKGYLFDSPTTAELN